MPPLPFHFSKRASIVAAGVMAAFFIAGGAYVYAIKTNNRPELSQVPILNQVFKGAANTPSTSIQGNKVDQAVVTLTPTTSQQLSLPRKQGGNSYISQVNRVGFYYSPSYGIKESGNRVTIYSQDNPTVSQWVEVFPKVPGDTIQQTIIKAVLTGYNTANCPIGAATTDGYKYPSNIQTASIRYSSDNIDQYGDVVDTSKCPIAYTNQSESRLYFLIDTNHPGKLLFFHLNGIGIPGLNNDEWQDSITLF